VSRTRSSPPPRGGLRVQKGHWNHRVASVMIDKSATLFAAGDVGGLLDLNHTRINNLASVTSDCGIRSELAANGGEFRDQDTSVALVQKFPPHQPRVMGTF